MSKEEGERTYACCAFSLGEIELAGRAQSQVVGDDSVDFGAKRLDCDCGHQHLGISRAACLTHMTAI